jgi:hypothetical protein
MSHRDAQAMHPSPEHRTGASLQWLNCIGTAPPDH